MKFMLLVMLMHEGGGVVSKLLRVHKLLQSGDCSKMVGLVLFDCKSRVLIAH